MDEPASDTLMGREVSSADDEKIGAVVDVDVDPRTGDPRWLVVEGRLVPAEGAWLADDEVIVPYTADQIRTAPTIADGGEVDGVRHRTASVHYVRSSVEQSA